MAIWSKSNDTYIWIFNVGRGISIFVRTPNNNAIVYDLGASDDFSPIEFYRKHLFPNISGYYSNNKHHPIAQTIISHPHLDHIYEVDRFRIEDTAFITCPHHLPGHEEEFDFSTIENHDKLNLYKALYYGRKPPLQSLPFSHRSDSGVRTEYGLYYVRPPKVKPLHGSNGHKYGNGCSIVMYYKHGKNSILIPGDITPEALEHLLDEKPGFQKRYSYIGQQNEREEWTYRNSSQPSLKDMLSKYGLSVLVPPHHGLESCYSEYLATLAKPQLHVISEKRTSATEGKIDGRYQSQDGSHGMKVEIDGQLEFRHSVTTKTAHHYLVKFTSGNEVKVYGAKDPTNLLNK